VNHVLVLTVLIVIPTLVVVFVKLVITYMNVIVSIHVHNHITKILLLVPVMSVIIPAQIVGDHMTTIVTHVKFQDIYTETDVSNLHVNTDTTLMITAENVHHVTLIVLLVFLDLVLIVPNVTQDSYTEVCVYLNVQLDIMVIIIIVTHVTIAVNLVLDQVTMNVSVVILIYLYTKELVMLDVNLTITFLMTVMTIVADVVLIVTILVPLVTLNSIMIVILVMPQDIYSTIIVLNTAHLLITPLPCQ
jgi:hypothetical protein